VPLSFEGRQTLGEVRQRCEQDFNVSYVSHRGLILVHVLEVVLSVRGQQGLDDLHRVAESPQGDAGPMETGTSLRIDLVSSAPRPSI
jgi:hypothetical protein